MTKQKQEIEHCHDPSCQHGEWCASPKQENWVKEFRERFVLGIPLKDGFGWTNVWGEINGHEVNPSDVELWLKFFLRTQIEQAEKRGYEKHLNAFKLREDQIRQESRKEVIEEIEKWAKRKVILMSSKDVLVKLQSLKNKI